MRYFIDFLTFLGAFTLAVMIAAGFIAFYIAVETAMVRRGKRTP